MIDRHAASATDGGPASRSNARLAAAFLLGAAGALIAFVFGVPGQGAFVPVLWLTGFVAAVVAPGWRGFLALLGGGALGAVLLDVVDGAFGLVLLVVTIVCVLAAHGALSGWVASRLKILGPGRALREGRVLVGLGVAMAGLVAVASLGLELARNPP